MFRWKKWIVKNRTIHFWTKMTVKKSEFNTVHETWSQLPENIKLKLKETLQFHHHTIRTYWEFCTHFVCTVIIGQRTKTRGKIAKAKRKLELYVFVGDNDKGLPDVVDCDWHCWKASARQLKWLACEDFPSLLELNVTWIIGIELLLCMLVNGWMTQLRFKEFLKTLRFVDKFSHHLPFAGKKSMIIYTQITMKIIIKQIFQYQIKFHIMNSFWMPY